MFARMGVIALMCACFAACEPATEPAAPTPAQSAAPAPTEHEEQVTELPPVTIGDYEVAVNYEGPVEDGHFNFHVTGPEFTAIRQWVGPEDAAGVVVGRAEVLSDHIHAGVEMPDPLPGNPTLWIEIETPEGQRLKGSIPLDP